MTVTAYLHGCHIPYMGGGFDNLVTPTVLMVCDKMYHLHDTIAYLFIEEYGEHGEFGKHEGMQLGAVHCRSSKIQRTTHVFGGVCRFI